MTVLSPDQAAQIHAIIHRVERYVRLHPEHFERIRAYMEANGYDLADNPFDHMGWWEHIAALSGTYTPQAREELQERYDSPLSLRDRSLFGPSTAWRVYRDSGMDELRAYIARCDADDAQQVRNRQFREVREGARRFLVR